MSLHQVSVLLLRHSQRQAQLQQELHHDLAEPVASDAPSRPLPVKALLAVAIVMVMACVGGYLASSKWQAVRQEQQRLADPLRAFTDEPTAEKQLLTLQAAIRANPQAQRLLSCACGERTRSSIRRWRRCAITSPGSI